MGLILPVRHKTQEGNDLRNDCGPACGWQVVNALTGADPTLRQLKMAAGGGLHEFTSILGLIRMLDAYGLKGQNTLNASLGWVIECLDQGIAPVLLVDYPSLGSEIQYRYAHFVVAVGYDAHSVYINDPLRLTGAWPATRARLAAALNTKSTWVKRDEQGRLITGKNAGNQAVYVPSPTIDTRPARECLQAQIDTARGALERIRARVEPGDYRKAQGVLSHLGDEPAEDMIRRLRDSDKMAGLLGNLEGDE